MMLMQSMFNIGCVAVACQNKSGLLNTSWISAYCETYLWAQKFCCCISKSSSTSGGFVLLTPWAGTLALDPIGGTAPRPPLWPPLPLQKYFWHYLWNKLCTPVIHSAAMLCEFWISVVTLLRCINSGNWRVVWQTEGLKTARCRPRTQFHDSIELKSEEWKGVFDLWPVLYVAEHLLPVQFDERNTKASAYSCISWWHLRFKFTYLIS